MAGTGIRIVGKRWALKRAVGETRFCEWPERLRTVVFGTILALKRRCYILAKVT